MAKNPTYVVNVAVDVSWLHDVFVECVRNRSELPEEIADLFTWKVIDVNGEARGILGAA